MSSEGGSLFTKERATAIVKAMREGKTQAQAADAAGIGFSTLRLWLMRGQTDPAGKYGPFARQVIEVYFQRRKPVAWVRFDSKARRVRRVIEIHLGEPQLTALPPTVRKAIASGSVVPTEVLVRFERREE